MHISRIIVMTKKGFVCCDPIVHHLHIFRNVILFKHVPFHFFRQKTSNPTQVTYLPLFPSLTSPPPVIQTYSRPPKKPLIATFAPDPLPVSPDPSNNLLEPRTLRVPCVFQNHLIDMVFLPSSQLKILFLFHLLIHKASRNPVGRML